MYWTRHRRWWWTLSFICGYFSLYSKEKNMYSQHTYVVPYTHTHTHNSMAIRRTHTQYNRFLARTWKRCNKKISQYIFWNGSQILTRANHAADTRGAVQVHPIYRLLLLLWPFFSVPVHFEWCTILVANSFSISISSYLSVYLHSSPTHTHDMNHDLRSLQFTYPFRTV